MRRRRLALALGLAALPAAAALAHVRIQTVGGTGIYWNNAQNIPIVINSAGSDDVPDESDFTAIRIGLDAWNDVAGSNARFVENTDPAQQARTDWMADDLKTVWFDETNSTGFFPGGSGTVGLTFIEFFADGRIADADILVNGSAFDFTTDPDPSAFDIQTVVTHELGHFLGLDHTGWAGATMYPFVSETVIVPRSLSEDDENGVQHVYTSAPISTIRGTVRRQSDNSRVSGAHVICRDATTGRSAGGALAASDGQFRLRGLDAGTYEIVAHPLSGVVTDLNLGIAYPIETDFDATAHTSTVTVGSGTTTNLGDLVVTDPAGNVQLGSLGDGLPLEAEIGATSPVLLIIGTGLAAASTFTGSDPAVTLTNVNLSGNLVSFQVTVPPGATPGHFDLTVSNGGGTAILPAAIEIVPPAPTVTAVNPTTASPAGGTALTITGTGFRPGARVVIAGNVYQDGDPGVSVVGPTMIALTTAPSSAGIIDVVVIDESGIEGRLQSVLEIKTVPVAATLFPTGGSAAGGTQLVITGADFDVGVTVRIDGVLQPQVARNGPDQLTVTTEPGIAGGPYVVTVENPNGETDTGQTFSYAAQPDPAIGGLTPAKAPPAGGKLVTLAGTNLTAATQVHFGVDPLTGTGGTPAALVTFVDANTLDVTTPPHAKGVVAVMVSDPVTGQAFVLDGGFTFKSSGGGGGGGCHTEIVAGPPDAGRMLLGSWWAAALLMLMAVRMRRMRRPAPVRS